MNRRTKLLAILPAHQKGDTIIEVMLAMAFVATILASAYALTNRATRLGQTAYERTASTTLMRTQIERIRNIRYTNPSTWQTITNSPYSSGIPPNYNACDPSTSKTPFFIDDSGSIVSYANNFPHNFFRIWAEAYRPSSTSEYVDIHVRSCWEGIGGEVEQRSALILRIY